MADKEYKTIQEKKSKGKYSTKDKEIYNSKYVRKYENKMSSVSVINIKYHL